MTKGEMMLRAALQQRGVRSPDAFEQRYGVAFDTLTTRDALTLVLFRDHPRSFDRSTWTPVQRANYCAGCVHALTAIKARLERGLLILSEQPTVAAEVHWFRLATRAIRLIGKHARVSPDAGGTFCTSDLGRWYGDLEWPVPSDAALMEEW